MTIQVLYFEGCPNYQAAIELVRSVAPGAKIEPIQVRTQEDAVRMRFLGSPTILIDGVDLEPQARGRADFGFACRTYAGAGVPSRQLVEWAINESQTRPVARPRASWFAGGSAVLALAATACCWLPLILVGMGLGSAGLASSTEALRPWLLAASGIVLVVGLFSACRGVKCRTCPTRWADQALVWMAALCLVGAAVLPSAAGPLFGCAMGQPCCAPSESATPSVQADRDVETKTRVIELAEDAHQLKEAFNADQDAPRVMLIVSPLCPACRSGASTIQKDVLARIESDKLRVYVVWIKRFPGDSLKAAQDATELVSDRRARHYWDASGALGKQFGKSIELPKGKKFAWDVYFLFAPGARWDENPPKPVFWMHQLGSRDTGNLLDGPRFRDAVADTLP